MEIDNKIENIFGKNAVFAGYIFLFAGFAFLYFTAYITGILLMIISGFIIFSFTGVEIDTEKRQVRQYDKYFGIIKNGKWKSLDSFRGITFIPFVRTDTMASWSNRITSVKRSDYRIYLVNKALKPAFAIKRCNTKEEALGSLDEFSLLLKLPVYTVKL